MFFFGFLVYLYILWLREPEISVRDSMFMMSKEKLKSSLALKFVKKKD